jgi:hypothetical protein
LTSRKDLRILKRLGFLEDLNANLAACVFSGEPGSGFCRRVGRTFGIKMNGFRKVTKPWRIAVLAIYTVFSLFGGLAHGWSHHALHDGCGASSCSESLSDHCDEISTHSHGHSCGKHKSAHAEDCPAKASADHTVQRPLTDAADSGVELCVKVGRHACKICDQIASLMQCWSASGAVALLVPRRSEFLVEAAKTEVLIRPLMARSRAPPARG